jgi:uncharacterized phage protein (TIGR01671 family)
MKMREIKVRTFVKETKEMIYGRRAMAVKMFTPNYSYTNNEVEVTQFTGLKDKKGKEIYIGDLVSFEESVYEIIINDFMQIPVLDSGSGQDYLYKWHDKIEVIGNVYENPEIPTTA